MSVRRERLTITAFARDRTAATAALAAREARRSAPRTGNASNVRQTVIAPAAKNVRGMCANVRAARVFLTVFVKSPTAITAASLVQVAKPAKAVFAPAPAVRLTTTALVLNVRQTANAATVKNVSATSVRRSMPARE